MSRIVSENPATGEIIWEGHSATQSEIDEAVHAARKAFETWSGLPLEKRVQHLKKFREALSDSKEQLAEVISKETGKPLWESKGEVAAMIGKVNISIDAYAQRCPNLKPDQLHVTHKPHGVAAVFGPFNFPGHLPNGHIVPALLAGNTVVFKPSELTPLVGEMIKQLWELPEGVINLIQGGPETGHYVAEHPDIDALFFTGSWNTGSRLAEYFGKHPEKILALEMGGNNPLIVSTVSDLKAAAYLTIQSAFLTSGQRCSCARRLIVIDGDDFIQELVKMSKQIKIGPYTDDPEPFMGPVISEKAAQNIMQAQEQLQGSSLLEMKQNGAFLSPGIMDVTNVSERPDEEIFGPFLQLIRVKDFDGAIQEANHTSYGLAAGLLSDHREEYEEFYRKARAGIVNWNTPLTGASSAAPFGGIGRSGNHRPSAYYAADYCCYPMASMEIEQLKIPKNPSPGITL